MKTLKKIITKYGFLLLSVVLIVLTIFDYKEYKELLLQIEQKNLLIDVLFNGWIVAFSFVIICFYEFTINNMFLKLSIRIFLGLLFLGITFKNTIPIEDFNSGIENTTVFSGLTTVILLILLGLKKIRSTYYGLKKKN